MRRRAREVMSAQQSHLGAHHFLPYTVNGANIDVTCLDTRTGRIGGMAFSFLYLAVRALLGMLIRSRRGLHVKARLERLLEGHMLTTAELVGTYGR